MTTLGVFPNELVSNIALELSTNHRQQLYATCKRFWSLRNIQQREWEHIDFINCPRTKLFKSFIHIFDELLPDPSQRDWVKTVSIYNAVVSPSLLKLILFKLPNLQSLRLEKSMLTSDLSKVLEGLKNRRVLHSRLRSLFFIPPGSTAPTKTCVGVIRTHLRSVFPTHRVHLNVCTFADDCNTLTPNEYNCNGGSSTCPKIRYLCDDHSGPACLACLRTTCADCERTGTFRLITAPCAACTKPVCIDHCTTVCHGCGLWYPFCSARCRAVAVVAASLHPCSQCGAVTCKECSGEFARQTHCQRCARPNGAGYGYAIAPQKCSRCAIESGAASLTQCAAQCADCGIKMCSACMDSWVVVGCRCGGNVCGACTDVHDCDWVESEDETMREDEMQEEEEEAL